MKRKIMSIVLCIFMVLSLMPIAAIAAEAGHRHCICGEADCTEHGGEQAWEPLPADGVPTTPGTYYYYLDRDRTQRLLVDRGVTLYLCLNGKALKGSNVNDGGVLNICDCSTEKTGQAGSVTVIRATANLYSGTGTFEEVRLGNFNMYGGTLFGIRYQDYGLRATASNVNITGGVFTKSEYVTGGIYATSSTVTISDAEVRGNEFAGLAINASEVTLNCVTISGNGSREVEGAGIYAKDSVLTMTDCVVESNSRAGIYMLGGKLTMMSCRVESNGTDGVKLSGYADFILNSGEIKNNPNGVNVSSGNFTLTGGTISENTDRGVLVSGGTFEMNGGVISKNTIGVSAKNASFEMVDGMISNNNGVGIATDSSTIKMRGGEISYNGRGVTQTGGSFEITGGKISNNTSSELAGGVYLVLGTFTMNGGEISNNIANGHGGGLYLQDGTIVLTDGKICNNTSSASGGGIYSSAHSLTISNCTIKENQATKGGGIFADSYDVNIVDSEISNNKATENGGAILSFGLTELKLGGNTRITSNEAQNGGAVYMYYYDRDSSLFKNYLFLSDNAVISGNTATGNGGGIYSTFYGHISLNGGNISGNSAGTLGGGIYFAGTELNISGASAVGGNLANGVADDIYLPEGKKIHVIGELDNASVGIRMENPDTFTNNYSVLCGTADPASFFVSNDIQKTVALTPDNAEARLIDGHTHGDWSYTANGATLTATCGSDSYSETLTVSAQSEYVYDGTAKTASLSEQGGMLSDLRVALITYNTEDGKAPTAPGEYTASITVGGATASVSFEITIDGVDAPTPTQTEYFYTGEAQSCFNIPEDALYTATGNTQTEVGEYIVTLSLKDKEHLVWNDSGNTDDKVYTFVIKKAAVQEPSAPTSEIVYNGAPQSYFGNIDTSLYTAINNTQTNAGSYTVTLSLKDKTNRVWSSSGSNADLKFTFNIAKAPLSIAVKDQTVQINDSISSTLDDVTLSDPAQLMGGDALHGVTLTGDTSTATNIGHISLGAVVIKNGETDVTDNYKLESTNGNLTVLPEALPSVKTLTGIIVTRSPDKTSYNVGDSFNPAGMVVTATYSVVSGEQTFTTSDTVTTYTVTDGSNLPEGKAFVTIRYTENGITKETTQAIHIHGNATLVSKTPATCTADGEMAHYLCGCGVRFLDENCTQPVRSADDLVIGALGHNMGDWISNDDDTHTRACKRDGCVYKEDGECHGGTMTCVQRAVCDVCKEEYGGLADHDCDTGKWLSDESGHWHECKASGCDAKLYFEEHNPDREEATEEHGIKCTECGYEIAPRLPHTHRGALVSGTPATCTSEGTRDYYLCDCGERFFDPECTQPVGGDEELVIGKAPHSDENNDGKCDNCQADLGGEEPQKSCRDKFLDFVDSANRAIVEFFNKIGDFFRNLFK